MVSLFLLIFIFVNIQNTQSKTVQHNDIYHYNNLEFKQLNIDPDATTYGTINFDGQNTGFLNRFTTFRNENITINGKGLTQSNCSDNNGFWYVNPETNMGKCLCYAPFSGDRCQNQEYNIDFYKVYAKIYYDDGTPLASPLNATGKYPGIDGNLETKSMLKYPYFKRYSWYTVVPETGALYPDSGGVDTPSSYCIKNGETKGFYIINDTVCYVLFGIYIIEFLNTPDPNYVLFIKKTSQYDFAVKDKMYAVPDPEYTGMPFLPKPYWEYENTEIEGDFFENALEPILTVNKKLEDEITTKREFCFYPNPMFIMNGKVNFHDGLKCPISTSQYPFGISDVYQCKFKQGENDNKNNFPIIDSWGNVSWLLTKPTKTCKRQNGVEVRCCKNECSSVNKYPECLEQDLSKVDWLSPQCPTQSCSERQLCWPRPKDKQDAGGGFSCGTENIPCCKQGDFVNTKYGCLYCLQYFMTQNKINDFTTSNLNDATCRDLMPRSNVGYFISKSNDQVYSRYVDTSKLDTLYWQITTRDDLESGVTTCCRDDTSRIVETGVYPVSTINPPMLYFNQNNNFTYYQANATKNNSDYGGGSNYPTNFTLNSYDPKYTNWGPTFDSQLSNPESKLKTMTLNSAYTNSDYVGDLNFLYLINTLKDKTGSVKMTYQADSLKNYRQFGNMYFKSRIGIYEPYTFPQSYTISNDYSLGYDYAHSNYFIPRGLNTYSESVGNFFQTFYNSIYYVKTRIPSCVKIKLPEYTYIVNRPSSFNMDPNFTENVGKKYPEIYIDNMNKDTGYDLYFLNDMVQNLVFPPTRQTYQSILFNIPCSTRCSYPDILSTSIPGVHMGPNVTKQQACSWINKTLYPNNNKANPQNVC